MKILFVLSTENTIKFLLCILITFYDILVPWHPINAATSFADITEFPKHSIAHCQCQIYCARAYRIQLHVLLFSQISYYVTWLTFFLHTVRQVISSSTNSQ